MNGPANLPPAVASIMAQINALPAELRAVALNALGHQVVVAADETRKELQGKTTEAYRQAVKAVFGNIPQEMNWSHGSWRVLREGLKDPRSYMVNSMGFEARPVTEDEIQKFIQAADNYRVQLAAVEQDSDSIDYTSLTVEEIVTLLAAESPVLIEKGTLFKIAKLAKEKLLSYPQATEESNETCVRFRTHYTYADAVREIVKNCPLESDQEGIELLKRIQPHCYLGDDGVCRVEHVFKTVQMSFAQMVGEALLSAPEWATKLIVDKSYDGRRSYRTDAERMYLLAKAAAPVKGLELRIRKGFEKMSFQKFNIPQQAQELFEYYLHSFRALQLLEKVAPQLLEKVAPQRKLQKAMNHATRDYRIWARDVEGIDVDRRVLIEALVWEDLLTMFKTEQGELKAVINNEILRQLRGEPESIIFDLLDRISLGDLPLLKSILLDQKDLREKLRQASYGNGSIMVSKERKDFLKRKLGL